MLVKHARLTRKRRRSDLYFPSFPKHVLVPPAAKKREISSQIITASRIQDERKINNQSLDGIRIQEPRDANSKNSVRTQMLYRSTSPLGEG